MNPQHINYSLAYSFADETIMSVREPSRIGTPDIVADFLGFRSEFFFNAIEKPQKWTILHQFIYNVNNFGIQYYLGKLDGEEIIDTFGPYLDNGGIARPTWFNNSSVQEYYGELSNLLDTACQTITNAAFQLLYADRTFLFEFNQFIAPYISQLSPHEHSCIERVGVVKRCYFPVWLKNAVFHRDKGRCQLCGCDLTNLLVPTGQRHIDHMVPLKAYGTNDPTNFQLACEACNKAKGAKVLAEKHVSYTYW